MCIPLSFLNNLTFFILFHYCSIIKLATMFRAEFLTTISINLFNEFQQQTFTEDQVLIESTLSAIVIQLREKKILGTIPDTIVQCVLFLGFLKFFQRIC